MMNNLQSIQRILAQLSWPPARMALLVRSKRNGPGKHYGVLLDGGTLATRVLELQKREGTHFVTPTKFAGGRPVTTEIDLRTPAEIAVAMERARGAVRSFRSYGLFDSNCEHFARTIMEGRRASWQISTVLAIAVAGLVLLPILRRAS